ncbi:AAC(3) family N-acetyltransferase [Actinocrinis puniceicyclus]|uniref:Aminoglycoside N(3)-acetyltransferase n=1 Tax=Actinocrinis puniceicyclus TaxID=977794 RepID=A0A8J7WNV3_9ACTN|nr:AAC(3) family N-acetyltransferase [Actinocrinis puniceicyclus]MBS2963224.1 AAC(3) family N-acetyltransferase [Actinocrinis puniceicyclus]
MTQQRECRRLTRQLAGLGLAPGDIVLVHCSLRRVAPRTRCAYTVARALLDQVGSTGTVVVPTQTAWNSTTSRVHRQAVAGLDAEQVKAYRAGLPAFDPRTTPSSGMGALAECVRTMPGACRSTHPQTSLAAVGPRARQLMAVHKLECHLGWDSPLGALHEADAKVLLLGVGYDACTAFHLAEYAPQLARPRRAYQCRIADWPGDGWTAFEGVDLDDSRFGRLGRGFEAETGAVRTGPVGAARARLFGVRAAYDFALRWWEGHASGFAPAAVKSEL